MKKFFLLLIVSLLLLGCLGGGGQAALPSSKPSPAAAPPAASEVEFFVSSLPSQKLSKLQLQVSLVVDGNAFPAQEIVLLPPRDSPTSVGGFKAQRGEWKGASLSLSLVTAELNGVEKTVLMPAALFGVARLRAANKPVKHSFEVQFNPDASLHASNNEELVFLPVAEVLFSTDGERVSANAVGMNEGGEVGPDKIVSPALKILVSRQGGKAVFAVDNSPPEIPLG